MGLTIHYKLSLPATFTRTDVQEILDTLCALGRVRPGDTAGTYVR